MKTVILVPYRAGRHDPLWQFVKQHHQEWHPGWPIFEGQSPPGLFNRSAAINDAAQQTGWDAALIVDADTYVSPEQLEEAVDLAAVTNRLVAAFTRVVELDRYSTDWLLQTGDANGLPALHTVRIRRDAISTQSSALVITRALWDKAGGFDERFRGYGAEDNAFWRACSILGGEPLRVEGPAYHLYHHSTRPPRFDPQYRANQTRWRRYVKAQTAADLLELHNA